MTRRVAIAAAVAAAVFISTAGYMVGARRTTDQRAQLLVNIETYTNFLNTIREQRVNRTALTSDLDGFVSRTLGGKFETVDSRLRERLNRIGEELQLKQLTVSTARPAPLGTPAKTRYGLRDRALRDEIDFYELEGSVSGEGSLEHALRLAHRIQCEPWIKRVNQFKLDPRENGKRFMVTLRLTTLYLPDREPRELPGSTYDASGFEPYAKLVAANPFRVPIPESPAPDAPPTAVAAKPATPPTPGFAYGQWKLTLIAQGVAGPEVGLLNSSTGESRTLLIGQSLQQATLVAVLEDQAHFKLGEDQFLVAVGQSLDDKQPVKR